jgi:hypothetical protein
MRSSLLSRNRLSPVCEATTRLKNLREKSIQQLSPEGTAESSPTQNSKGQGLSP